MVSDAAVTLCVAVSSHMYDQQEVSDISMILFWPVLLHDKQLVSEAAMSFCQVLYIDQQFVSDIATIFCQSSQFITLINSLWVTPREWFLSSLIGLTYSKWVCMWFSTSNSSHIDPMTNRMWVSLLPHTTITSHPMTNRKWAALQWFSAITTSHSMTNREWVTL